MMSNLWLLQMFVENELSHNTDYTAVIVHYLWEEMGIIILHPNSELE